MHHDLILIFDFDGVIVDSVNVKAKAFAKLYESHGDDVVQKVMDYHSENGGVTRRDKFRYYENFILGKKNVSEQALDSLCDNFSDIVTQAVIASPLIEGAIEFLTKYRADIPMYIASATPESELLYIVEQKGLNHFFAGVYGAPIKKSMLVRNIVARNFSYCNRFLMVGDASVDYDAAKHNGIGFIGISNDASVFPDALIVMNNLTPLSSYIKNVLPNLAEYSID